MSVGSAHPTVTFPRPEVSAERALRLAHELYGLTGGLQELPSERDRNFLLTTAAGERFVLKVAHPSDSPDVLDLQHQALHRLAAGAPGLAMPRVRRSLAGRELERLETGDGTAHLVRVLTWIPGDVWARCPYHSPELLRSLGRVVGEMDRALGGFAHPAARRHLKWDLTRPGWIREHVHRVDGVHRVQMVQRVLQDFDRETLAAVPRLRRGIIHNDANDWNVIVGGDQLEPRVVGVVDFGDMLETAVVAELAIACAYAVLGKPDPLGAAAEVVRGYHEAFPLGEDELAVLFPLIRTRLAVSVVNAACQREAASDNEYLLVSEQPAWEALERLETVHSRLAQYTFRAAAGLEPCPATPSVSAWLRAHAREIGPVVDLDGQDRIHVLDLSVGSPLIETPVEPDDLAVFTRKLFDRIGRHGARIGLGRYDEARLVYSTEAYRADGNDRPVARTVHIGLDLFVEPGTPVLAPLDGVVESVRDNAAPRDYGPTVILRHDAGGTPFWSLYGHLGRDCLVRLAPGRGVTRGERIGTIGEIEVNGGWSPHLHLQIITDLLDQRGDFAGVCRPDQRNVWESLCPDPNLITGFAVPASPHRRGPEILERRRRLLGPSLSISYRRPLTMVRGWMQWLYDEDGLTYLDAVNNVPHVGHSHPGVVRALREQATVLNTNTRYLHELLAEYAERLTATLPPPLRVCYLVNSGSEANELAIRLARAATGRRGMVVVDVGYHGNTTTLVDVSPYKHDGPGGKGPPSWVRKIPMPDVYRGPWRRDDPAAGHKYGATVSEAIAALEANGEALAAFLAESVLSCGGQIVLPDGFLAEAYARTRAAGGVCIADEVQVGLGRAGTHFWAFETQGVVPDILTLGKPIGNGHPLGAVITTPEVARAFDNGMEFFSTFGGNPVSCAAGLAVLDVIAEENLQEHARVVGAHLLAGLRQLVARHPIAGDARGLGLFLGLELVRDREALAPAGAEACYVANRLRDRGTLLSTDGPFHNVLKIKPPLCFTREDADRLVAELDVVLAELAPLPR